MIGTLSPRLAALGVVRLSHLSRRDSVTRRGDQISAYVDERLAALVREARADLDRQDDPMLGMARVTRGAT